MKSVTQRIKEIKQPYGGYLSISQFKKITINDRKELYEEENISASLIGTTVDYMTRFYFSRNINDAFNISLKGASIIGKSAKANNLLKKIKGTDKESIIAACQLVGFDVCYRAGTMYYRPVEEIIPDKKTIFNIKTMIIRSIDFIKEYGPIVKDCFTFEGGYTQTITHGDGDFLTKDTLWDFKVTKSTPSTAHTLQLLVYYLMGKHSIHKSIFSSINKLGIYNPRKNIIYLLNVGNISKDTIKEVEDKVIGYGNKKERLNNTIEIPRDVLTISDLMHIMKCSRHMIMKYYNQYGLPLYKEKNKYVIDRNSFEVWLIEKKKREDQLIIFTIVFLILLLLFCLILF